MDQSQDTSSASPLPANGQPALSYATIDRFGRRGRDGRFRWSGLFRSTALFVGWVVVAAVCMLGLGLIGGKAVIPVIVVLGPVSFFIFIAGLTQVMRALRRRRAAAVLSYVEQAVRLSLPLPRMLRAAQYSETGQTARRLGAVCDVIEAGATVGVALDAEAPEIPDRAVRLAGAAERLGQLAPMLRNLLKQERGGGDRGTSPATINLTYALIVLIFISITIGLYMIFVMPKFEQIFKDFGIELPEVTKALVSVSRWFADDFGWLFLLPPVAVAALVYPALRLGEIFVPGEKAQLQKKWRDWIAWRLPLARGIARDQGLADVCRVTADGLRAGFTLDCALAEAVDLEINRGFRCQVRDWLTAARQGLGPADAARHAGLPPLLVGLLGAARGSGATADVLDFASRYYQTRVSRTVLLLKGAISPAMTLVFGAIVCAVALSIFTPMIRLIEKVGMQWDKL